MWTDSMVREISDSLGVDAGSVVRRIVGLPVRGRTGERIDRALRGRPGGRAMVGVLARIRIRLWNELPEDRLLAVSIVDQEMDRE
jgi:hypothetical protein